MEEQDLRVSLLDRLVQHARTTARYSVFYGHGRDRYDVRGRTAHEVLFNVANGSCRGPSTQQGYSPFSTWTRGLAWAMLGFAEELEFVETLPAAALDGCGGRDEVTSTLLEAARATCDRYIEDAAADGIPYWDTGAPGLAEMEGWRGRPADPFNDHEPVDSSAAAIAAQGLLRLGRAMGKRGDGQAATRYEQAGLRIADVLFDESGPYLSTDETHQGLLLHSVYHWPNGWDHVPAGAKVPRGESSMWGDYHAREVALYLKRLAEGETVPHVLRRGRDSRCDERGAEPVSAPRRRTALITGGTRGIGLGIARALASEGWALALCGQRAEADVSDVLADLRQSAPSVDYVAADLARADDRARLLEAVRARVGAVNALVNNAGRAPRVRADLLDATEESFEDLIRTNLQGPYFLTQAIARDQVAARQADFGFDATIVFVTSVSAEMVSVNRGEYCVSKAGLSMAARLFAVRLAGHGIPVFEVRTGDHRDRHDGAGAGPLRRVDRGRPRARATLGAAGGRRAGRRRAGARRRALLDGLGRVRGRRVVAAAAVRTRAREAMSQSRER